MRGQACLCLAWLEPWRWCYRPRRHSRQQCQGNQWAPPRPSPLQKQREENAVKTAKMEMCVSREEIATRNRKKHVNKQGQERASDVQAATDEEAVGPLEPGPAAGMLAFTIPIAASAAEMSSASRSSTSGRAGSVKFTYASNTESRRAGILSVCMTVTAFYKRQ